MVKVKSTAKALQQANRDASGRYLSAAFRDCSASVTAGLRAELTGLDRAAEMIASLFPRSEEADAYYAATTRKHFGVGGHGSKFTDPAVRSLTDVLLLAWDQRGSLSGDDTALFVSRGASLDAFRDGNRYLLVETPGTVGVLYSAGLADDTSVEIVRGKPGTPCSVVRLVARQETTTYAAIVVAADPASGADVLITMFPGMVTKPTDHPDVDALEGRTVTMGEVRRILGGDTWLNTRLVELPAVSPAAA